MTPDEKAEAIVKELRRIIPDQVRIALIGLLPEFSTAVARYLEVHRVDDNNRCPLCGKPK